MTHLRPVRLSPLLLAAALLAGCGKEPAVVPVASDSPGPTKHTGGRPVPSGGTPVVSIPGPGAADAGPPIAVTAEQLARDFQADERKAQEKYQGKWVLVDGACKEAYERNIGGTVSRLFYFKDYTDPVTRYTWLVKCTLDEPHWAAIDELTQGQKVKVKARCTGAVSQAIALEQGELVEAGPDPAVAIPAARLASEFAAGKDRARDAYNDRWLLVEGTVQDTTTKDPPTITLDGAEDKGKAVRVVARFRVGRDTDPGKVKKGDRVKLKGKGSLFLDDANVVLDECKLVK